jgi:hypothetical protein
MDPRWDNPLSAPRDFRPDFPVSDYTANPQGTTTWLSLRDEQAATLPTISSNIANDQLRWRVPK